MAKGSAMDEMIFDRVVDLLRRSEASEARYLRRIADHIDDAIADGRPTEVLIQMLLRQLRAHADDLSLPSSQFN
jgi:hypothetical protein